MKASMPSPEDPSFSIASKIPEDSVESPERSPETLDETPFKMCEVSWEKLSPVSIFRAIIRHANNGISAQASPQSEEKPASGPSDPSHPAERFRAPQPGYPKPFSHPSSSTPNASPRSRRPTAGSPDSVDDPESMFPTDASEPAHQSIPNEQALGRLSTTVPPHPPSFSFNASAGMPDHAPAIPPVGHSPDDLSHSVSAPAAEHDPFRAEAAPDQISSAPHQAAENEPLAQDIADSDVTQSAEESPSTEHPVDQAPHPVSHPSLMQRTEKVNAKAESPAATHFPRNTERGTPSHSPHQNASAQSSSIPDSTDTQSFDLGMLSNPEPAEPETAPVSPSRQAQQSVVSRPDGSSQVKTPGPALNAPLTVVDSESQKANTASRGSSDPLSSEMVRHNNFRNLMDYLVKTVTSVTWTGTSSSPELEIQIQDSILPETTMHISHAPEGLIVELKSRSQDSSRLISQALPELMGRLAPLGGKVELQTEDPVTSLTEEESPEHPRKSDRQDREP